MRIEKYLNASPMFALFVTYDQVLGAFQKKLSQEGVHFLQALILTGLFFEDGPLRPTDLTQALKVKKSNLSHALRGLEKINLIERASIAKDARGYSFSLTREGRKKVPRLIKLFDLVQDQLEKSRHSKKMLLILRRLTEEFQKTKFPR